MQIGLLKSINPSTFKDLILTPNEIIFGRSPKSTVILEDIRCSGFHCSLTPIQSSPWEFLIKDQSSNGTYLNGQLIGKGKSSKASFNDKIEILPIGKGIKQGSEIGFTIQEPPKRKNIESAAEKVVKQNDLIEEQATCTICYEMMLDPVVLYPCLHTFCELCFLDWKTRAADCPICRSPIQETRKNQIIQNIVGLISEKHPEKIKTIEKCRQCDKKSFNFKCKPNQKHVKCSKCNLLMPKRDEKKQSCEICKSFYCNLYFAECSSGLVVFKEYFNKDFYLPLGALGNNYEENILSEYLKQKKLPGSQFLDVVKEQSYFRLDYDSVVCEKCLENVKTELFDKLLEIFNQKDPVFNRKKCPKGRNCLLQTSVLHSQVYSHF